MSKYTATVSWKRDDAPFLDNKYSRAHVWQFDGGLKIPASSSPHVVPVPMSNEAAVDPEEAFIASLSSCHMLWFLFIAAEKGFTIDEYRDDAVGVLAKNAEGKIAITEVTLRPHVSFGGEAGPNADELKAMHDKAHDKCFIANSVSSVVRFEPS